MAILTFREALGTLVLALAACGGTVSTGTDGGAQGDAGRDASTGHDSGRGSSSGSSTSDAGSNRDAASHPDAGSEHDAAFLCGDAMCNGATSYCGAFVGGVERPDANNGPDWACTPFAQDCASPSCDCVNCAGSAEQPGQCGCYSSTEAHVTCLICAP
jgi:hypothetical protein